MLAKNFGYQKKIVLYLRSIIVKCYLLETPLSVYKMEVVMDLPSEIFVKFR